jgi:cation:H+ antiporter
MLLSILYILVGVVVVLWGADRLTEGAVGVAERLHIPQLVIGLTIVAIGTSMPEFCVSFVSALKGTADLAVGNVVGSNIFNSLLIVGITAMVAPMTILKNTVRLDIPFALLASIILAAFCYDGELTRLDAGILFGLFVVFMFITLQHAKKGKKEQGARSEKQEASSKEQGEEMPVWKIVLLILVGLACLVLGSNVFVDGATKVATALGISDAVIGLTVVAMGTSIPELATSVVAARKGNSGIAIGNVLGSNVFNILLVIGLTGVISPMHIQGITWIDLSMLILSMVLLLLFSYTKYTIARWEGAVLTTLFVGYITWVIMNL